MSILFTNRDKTRISGRVAVLMDVTYTSDTLGRVQGIPKEAETAFDLIEEFQQAANDADLRADSFENYTLLSSHYAALNTLPAVAGTKWVVNERIYLHFYDMLPPAPFKGGYRVTEPVTHTDKGILYSAYYRKDGKYWHEYVEILPE